MAFVDKLLTILALLVLAIFGGLLLLNRDSAQRMGRHIEHFTADALQLAMYCLIGATVFAGLAGLVLLWTWISKRRVENMRQRDGSYPLQRVHVAGGVILVDPNKLIGPAIGISGAGVAELFTADPDTHLRHAVERAKVSAMQALAPGDAAISDKYGSMHRPGAVLNAATGKHLAGAYERRQLPPSRIIGADPNLQSPISQSPRLTLRRVLERATPTALLAGQSDDGALATFNPRDSIHAGVIGATGTGKTTSVGYGLVAQALRTGHHVIVLDPKGGADWQPWSNHLEWHASDYQCFPDQIDALWAEHERRTALLREAGARSLDDPVIAGAIPHSLIVIEEYGDLIAQLRRSARKRADAVDDTLDRLMRLSRASGLHMLLLDQYPHEWSHQVLAGAKWLCIFKLGPGQGNKVGEYYAEKLPDHGRFIVRGKEYNAWFAAPHLDKLLAVTPPSQAPRIIDGTCTIHRSRTEAGKESTSGERPMNVHANDATNGAANAIDDNRWQPLIDRWFAEHPQALTGPAVGISDIARRMAIADTGSADAYERYKGIAHKLFHEFRANVRLPGGARLGADITHHA